MESTTTQMTDGQSSVNTGRSSGQSPVLPQGMARMEQTNAQSCRSKSLDRPPGRWAAQLWQIIYWSPDESEEKHNLKKVLDTTAKVLRDGFASIMPSKKQRGVKRMQPIPNSVFVKCPKLDPSISSKLPKTAKDTDWSLALLQTLVLDTHQCTAISTQGSAHHKGCGRVHPTSPSADGKCFCKHFHVEAMESNSTLEPWPHGNH